MVLRWTRLTSGISSSSRRKGTRSEGTLGTEALERGSWEDVDL